LSTNTGLTLNLLYNLPIPEKQFIPIYDLALNTRKALQQKYLFQEQVVKYNVKLLRKEENERCSCIKEVQINPLYCLKSSEVSTITIRDALDRGLFNCQVNRNIETVLNSIRFTNDNGNFNLAVKLILSAHPGKRFNEILGQEIPEPCHATKWLEHYEECKQSVRLIYLSYLKTRNDIDDLVFDMYKIFNSDFRSKILLGLPWEYGNRDSLDDDENNG
jgi:hypothetical protein